MNNSGGIFQVEEVLAPKVIRTPLRPYVELTAYTRPEGDEQIISRVRLEDDHFVMDLEGGEQVAVDIAAQQRREQEAAAHALGLGVERD